MIELPQWVHPSMPGLGLFGHHPAPAASRSNDWAHGLFQCADACVYLGVLACAPAVLYDIYSKSVESDTHFVPPNDPVLSAASCLASVCLCTACATTTTQVGFRGLDEAVDLYQRAGGAAEEGGVFDAVMRWLNTSPEWMHDGQGYELQPDESEDWWLQRGYAHYTRELLGAICECRACCCGAPRLPLGYVCTLGLLYPCMVCPTTFLLRFLIINKFKLRESWPTACAIAACCAPCALVQMNRQVSSAAAGRPTAATRAPILRSSQFA